MQRPAKPYTPVRVRPQPFTPSVLILRSPGGEIGRRKGLKIPRVNNPCRFESGPGHRLSIIIILENWIKIDLSFLSVVRQVKENNRNNFLAFF